MSTNKFTVTPIDRSNTVGRGNIFISPEYTEMTITFPDGKNSRGIEVLKRYLDDEVVLELVGVATLYLEASSRAGNFIDDGLDWAVIASQCLKRMSELKDTTTETYQLNNRIYYSNGLFYVRVDNWLLNYDPTSPVITSGTNRLAIQRRLRRFGNNLIEVFMDVVSESGFVTASVSRRGHSYDIPTLTNECAHELLTHGLCTPTMFTAFYKTHVYHLGRHETAIRDDSFMLMIDGKPTVYNINNAIDIYEDYLSGTLPAVVCEHAPRGTTEVVTIRRDLFTGFISGQAHSVLLVINGVLVETYRDIVNHSDYYTMLVKIAHDHPEFIYRIEAGDRVCFLPLGTIWKLGEGSYPITEHGLSFTVVQGPGNTEPYVTGISCNGQAVGNTPICTDDQIVTAFSCWLRNRPTRHSPGKW